MAGSKMYSNRYRNMYKACQFVAANPMCGNTAIANEIGVSRQAANNIMKDAIARGWVDVQLVDWRPNVKAQRYTIGKYFPFVTHGEQS